MRGYPPVYADNQMTKLPPVRTLVFVDESPISLNDGYFFLAATGNAWTDVPAARHSRGCNFSFADGHVEHWRWMDSRTLALTPSATTPNNPDLQRMQAAIAAP